jgi:outer membrane lipopolysaccharide assembly protein LptE/RlpB
MKKLFIIPLIFILLQNCGYTPIYSKNQPINFYIESLEFNKGDNVLANFIKINLQRYLRRNDNNIGYEIKAIINYNKSPLSKNSAGQIEEYNLISTVEFVIILNKTSKVYNITESFVMPNFSDEFQEIQYERNIKQNMARSIASKLLIQLTTLNVN